MTNETFSDRLKLAMQAKQFKQVDLIRAAQRRGVKLGKSHVSQYVSGKTVPRSDILHFLADVLQVDPDWLLAKDSTVNYTADTVSDSTESCSDPSAASLSQTKTGGSPMREFKKSSKLDNVLYDVRGPVVEEANRMEACGTQVLKLNIGNPAPFGFRTPDEVIYDMSHQLTDCEGYSPSQGLFSARKAIMQYAQLKKLPNVSIDDIYTGNGVSELINLCMSALLDDGDEILIPSPDYPLWTACATLAGGKAVHYICDEQSEWYPDIDDMRKKITDRTKAIVIINPNNPTGVLYPKELLLEIIQIARESGLLIFADEIYDRLVMDGKQHISLASLTEDVPVITLNGLSKSHCLCGYRCGWMVISGPRELTEDYRQGIIQLTSLRLCANTMAQIVIPAALDDMETPASMVRPGGRIYEQREATVRELEKIDGLSFVKNDAAFYIFPKLDVKKFNITNDKQFAHDLLDATNILLVPGSGFDWKDPDHFRIVMLPQADILSDAIRRMGTFLDGYKQK